MKNRLGIISTKYYQTKDLELLLGVSRQTINKLVHEGKLKAYQPRGHFRFLGSDILKYLEKSEVK